MKYRNYLTSAVLALALIGTASAADYATHTPGVNGYDLVSYQNAKRPVRGNGNFVAVQNGVTYLFSSVENRDEFQSNPDKYLPAYGGFCAFGVSVGQKFAGDPEVWRIVDGRLYLNLDNSIQTMWLEDIPGRISSADENWKKIKNKSPQEL